EVTKRTILECTALGKKARDEGNVPVALDHFGRVLALDNGNAEVLALVESVGRTQQRSRTVALGLGALGVVSLLGIGGWFFLGPSPEVEVVDAPIIGAIASAQRDAAQVLEDAGVLAVTALDAGAALVALAPDAGTTTTAVTTEDDRTGERATRPPRRV